MIMIIDDLADRPHDCDLLLDQTFGRSSSDYNALTPQQAFILCGAQYALLRPDFSSFRASSIERRSKTDSVQSIMISPGSMNLYNVTSLILNSFLYIKGRFDITVILSSQAAYLNEVKASIAKIEANTNHKCHLLLDIENMAEIMAQNDFAIGAGGTTSWERACLGMPAAIIELADNQKKLAHHLEDAGAVMNLGWHEDLNEHTIAETLGSTLTDLKSIRMMSHTSSNICDGQGTEKIIKALSQAQLNKNIVYRIATIDDADILLSWRNDQETRAASINQSPISYDDHINWLNAVLSHGDRTLYIVEIHNTPSATIRVDVISPTQSELSWTVAPNSRGQGLGRLIVQGVIAMQPDMEFIAQVKSDNTASLAIAQSAGMVKQSEENGVIILLKEKCVHED